MRTSGLIASKNDFRLYEEGLVGLARASFSKDKDVIVVSGDCLVVSLVQAILVSKTSQADRLRRIIFLLGNVKIP